MAASSENLVKKQIKKILDQHKVYHFSPFMAGMGRAGIPDIIACCNGFFLGIEAKSGKNKATELQLRELERIRTAGGYAVVINEANMDELPNLLNKLMEQW